MSIRVFCPHCGTEMEVSDGAFGTPLTTESNGMYYLIPKELHDNNVGLIHSSSPVDERLKALENAGVNVDRLREIMKENSSMKNIFEDDDPIVQQITSRGFIDNPELFRRWITAQTWRLIKNRNGWTATVRNKYDIRYVFSQTNRELVTLIKLSNKLSDRSDHRFSFFTLTDLNRIFAELMDHNTSNIYRHYENSIKQEKDRLLRASSYTELRSIVKSITWTFDNRDHFKPRTWLNCFKGAGAYYTLQNLIQSHGLIIPSCTDMASSLTFVEKIFKDIVEYEPSQRRWDILMSTLVKAVKETNFELRY